MIIETVTKELLERELNSPRFTLGLEACLSHTLSTELATRMMVGKKYERESLIYPDDLDVGDHVSCSGTSCEEYARFLYNLCTGENALDSEGDPTEDYALYAANNSQLRLMHPMAPIEGSEEVPNYDLFLLYVAPGRSFPIKDEVRENHDSRVKRICRPISIVANATYNDSVKLFFFQEKSLKIPYYDDKRLKEEFVKLACQPRRPNPRSEQYNVGKGVYDRVEKRINFKFDLDKFAYIEREM